MLRFLSALLTLPLVIILGFLWFGLAKQPLVRQEGITARVDRREVSSDGEAGLENWIRNKLSRLPFPSATRIRTSPPDGIDVAITIKTPLLLRPYLNLSGRLEVHGRRLHLSRFQVGSLSLSLGPFAGSLSVQLPAGSADSITLQGQRIGTPPTARPSLSFPWRAFSANPSALEAYHRVLARWSRRSVPHQSLLEPLRDLFRVARQRSSDQTAAEENRALLQVLTAFALGRDPATLFGLPRRPLRLVHLTLRGRNDLARHFLVSAVTSASGHAALSNALGLYKEFSDFDTGSGFSFSDLAADKAGTEFGTLAVTRPRRLQRLMVRARSEDWFMPSITGLPEHLSRREFQQRFQGSNRVAYDRLIELIERRIAACPLYRY